MILPNELVSSIFSWLDIYTLSNIYLHSPILNAFATPLLHDHITSLILTIESPADCETDNLAYDPSFSIPNNLYTFRHYEHGSQGRFFEPGAISYSFMGFTASFSKPAPHNKDVSEFSVVLKVYTTTDYHIQNESLQLFCSEKWHTSLLCIPSPLAHSDGARFEHQKGAQYIHFSAITFHLDWFAECCVHVGHGGRIDVKEGAYSPYLRRMWEKVEKEEWWARDRNWAVNPEVFDEWGVPVFDLWPTMDVAKWKEEEQNRQFAATFEDLVVG
ncbi:hypothetical protein HK097_009543 [Rhizophlyctis rosea]|uniref:F-box domain-containing protein n=1 Tax=Rhizophlyctis rosea TaxID=64517 RepID=A0AAD5SB46_9FUNG|nr:hypothetical protein HK097_009543 [Rhizophlyctis rosea]